MLEFISFRLKWVKRLSDQFTVGQFFERIINNAASATGRLRVRSALNPMLWLCGIISLPSFGAAWATSDVGTLPTILALIGGLPILATCIGFFYFAIFRPQNLQSEDYQIRHEALQLIKEKGSDIEMSPSSLESITNPQIRRISRNG